MWNTYSDCRCKELRHFALGCIGNTEPEHGFGDVRTVPLNCHIAPLVAVAYSGILFGRGGSTNSVEDRGQRERGSGGGSPLVSGSGGSCNLVQEISFHIVKFS